MKKYTFSFKGRQSGAIGIVYKIMDTYKAEDIHQALSYLYEDYSIITNLKEISGKEIPTTIRFQKVRSYTTRERNPKTGSYLYTRSDTINQ